MPTARSEGKATCRNSATSAKKVRKRVAHQLRN
jgi:hypothetical protein